MRTRTLLLLAVGCGLAILVAGGIQLLRISGDDSLADDLAIGDRAAAGDLFVTVVAADERDGLMRVEVTLGGVDDDEALNGFELLVLGAALPPMSAEQAGDGVCVSVTIAEQSCALFFDTESVASETRVLRVRRDDDQQRWRLADG